MVPSLIPVVDLRTRDRAVALGYMPAYRRREKADASDVVHTGWNRRAIHYTGRAGRL